MNSYIFGKGSSKFILMIEENLDSSFDALGKCCCKSNSKMWFKRIVTVIVSKINI